MVARNMMHNFEISLSSGNLQFNYNKSFLVTPKTAYSGAKLCTNCAAQRVREACWAWNQNHPKLKSPEHHWRNNCASSPSGCLPHGDVFRSKHRRAAARIFRFHRTSEPRGSRRRQKPFFRAHTHNKIHMKFPSVWYAGTKGGVKIEQTRQKSSPLSSGTDRIKRTCDAGQHLNRQLIDDIGAVMLKNWWFAAATAYFVERDACPFFTRLWGFARKEKSDTDTAQAGEKLLCK